MKITAWCCSAGATLAELNEDVNQLIKSGWEPLGTIVILPQLPANEFHRDAKRFYQPMVQWQDKAAEDNS